MIWVCYIIIIILYKIYTVYFSFGCIHKIFVKKFI